jgi:hypothetical protein
MLATPLDHGWLPWYTNNPNPLLSKAHLTTLNLSNFKMVEAMGLKIIASRSPFEWHYLRTKFHENLPSGSKVITGGHTDRHSDLISLLSCLESRLKLDARQLKLFSYSLTHIFLIVKRLRAD